MTSPSLASAPPPIRHLVPLRAENRWSDLTAVLIETDPSPVARLLGLENSPHPVVVERDVRKPAEEVTRELRLIMVTPR